MKQAYFGRIDEVNLKGAALHAVIELNPSALSQARALDIERRKQGKRGPLHGIPILLKVISILGYFYTLIHSYLRIALVQLHRKVLTANICL